MTDSEQPSVLDFTPEPERYEFHEAPAYHFGFGRRDFFKGLGGGIVVISLLSEALGQERPQGDRRRGSGQQGPQDAGAWIHIGEDGTITAFTGKVELGQNIRTSLAQAVAEELHAPLASIRVVCGDTALTPFDRGTFGSLTTPQMAPQIRRAAATAREVLLELAAETWKIEKATLRVADGRIIHPSTGQSVGFGELTKGQKLTKTITETTTITPASAWLVLGQSTRKIDGRNFVSGAHKYTADMKRPGMLYGKVLRPPAFGTSLGSVETKTAEAIPGVVVVRDGEFVGVAGPNEPLAARALTALDAEWKPSAQSSGNTLYEDLKKGSTDTRVIHSTGSTEEALAKADHRLEQSYTIAYIAHAPLEPRAAVAEWSNDQLTVWTGSQRPFAVRDDLAQAFRIPTDRVHVIVPDTGSGYGGKQSSEMAIEAARLAKGANKPVKVIWTREEEFTWAYFRPAGVIDIRSGVGKDGTLLAWEFRNYNSGASGIRALYEIANQRIEFHPTRSPLRQGSYRALASTANAFARESHIDELASALKLDPLEFRLRNLKDERLRSVLEAAAKAFGWGKTKPTAGHGLGIACGFEKGGYIATCAEIAPDRADGKVRVARVVAAFDCGAVVNPDHLKNQIEGALVMALGGALFEEVKFESGKILNPRFSRYRVPRFGDTPEIEVILVDRKEVPSAGGGETPMIALAPAVGNAIFNAIGKRLRSMPMVPAGLKV